MNDESTDRPQDATDPTLQRSDTTGRPDAAADNTAASTSAPPTAGPAESHQRPQPTLVVSRTPRGGGSRAGWIAFVLLILAAAAAGGVWYFVLRDQGRSSPVVSPSTSPATVSWAGAWGRTDGVAGGLAIESSGDKYTVSVYDARLAVTGSATATASSDGRTLAFTLPEDSSFSELPGPLDCELTTGSAADTAVFTVTAANQTRVSMPLQRVLALTPSSPAASPSSTASASPDTNAAPLSPEDEKIIAGVTAIQDGVIAWAARHGGAYPTTAEVSSEGGIASYVDPWPRNPETGRPMALGSSVGSYTYEQINGGKAYRLEAHLSGGATYTLR